jgi:hypothetical protein
MKLVLALFIIIAVTAIATTIIVPREIHAQGRQTYPKINEEEWIEVKPGEKYNCPECEMIFQGTEFTIWEHLDGDRVVVAVPITDNSTFLDEGFVYNYCFTGEFNKGCDDPRYEKYKVE